jgi:hypothetical protein
MTRQLLLSTVFTAGSSAVLACSCFGPESFCETLDPPFPNPEWWIPDEVVLAVKLGEFQYGMDVKIIGSFSGTLQPDDTVRVWGDCGLLCRHYVSTWADGDTVVWGFRVTDLAGNSGCGTSYEQPADYMISICGVYYLDYSNGIVSGPITSNVTESMTIDQFGQLVDGCLSTGMTEVEEEPQLSVRYDLEGPVLEWSGPSAAIELTITSVQGQTIRKMTWNGNALRIEGLAAGTYLVRTRIGDKPSLRRFVVN